jgi:ribosome biogenesis GTPase A
VWSKISRCIGCGIELQSTSPASLGFIPPQVEDKKICQRCYRLSHYGELSATPLTAEDELRLARFAISKAELVLLLLDPIDFLGTFLPELMKLAEGKLAVVLTKMDLLPPIAKNHEVKAWVQDQLAKELFKPLAIFPVSSKTGMGIPKLISFLYKRNPTCIALVGATNVGKSALLERLLPQDAPRPTVSTLAGTTLGINVRPWNSGQILDTPGLTPKGRMDKYLCTSCQTKAPASPINSKLYELAPGQALMFGSLGCVINSGDDTVLQAYLPGSIKLHRTTAEKGKLLLAEKPKWLGGHCGKCPSISWQEQQFALEPFEDLAIAGLGWLSVRRSPSKLTLILPQGIRVQVREALFQKR